MPTLRPRNPPANAQDTVQTSALTARNSSRVTKKKKETSVSTARRTSTANGQTTASSSRANNENTSSSAAPASSAATSGTPQIGEKLPARLLKMTLLEGSRKTSLWEKIQTTNERVMTIFIFPQADRDETPEWVSEFDCRLTCSDDTPMQPVGICPDSPNKVVEFCNTLELQVPVLCDKQGALLRALNIDITKKSKPDRVAILVLDTGREGEVFSFHVGRVGAVNEKLSRALSTIYGS